MLEEFTTPQSKAAQQPRWSTCFGADDAAAGLWVHKGPAHQWPECGIIFRGEYERTTRTQLGDALRLRHAVALHLPRGPVLARAIGLQVPDRGIDGNVDDVDALQLRGLSRWGTFHPSSHLHWSY